MSAKPILRAGLMGLMMASVASAQPSGPMPMSSPEYLPAPRTSSANPPMPIATMPGSAASLMAHGFTPLGGPAPTGAGAVIAPPGASPNMLATPPSYWSNDGGPLPMGRDGIIGQELYTRYGLSLATGEGILARSLNGGFMIEGGAKALFFNPQQDAAWVLRGGLTLQAHRNANNQETFDFFDHVARVRRLFRFSGIVSFGRDWFFHGALPVGDGISTLRAGMDLGTRWGTQRAELDILDGPVDVFDGRPDFIKRTGNYGGIALGWHANAEVPMGSWVLYGGFRVEYGYNWSNLLPGQNSNIHEVNLLFTTGFRY